MLENVASLIATNEEPPANWSGTSAVFGVEGLEHLPNHPVAMLERGAVGASRDHVHLAVYDDEQGNPTDLVRWWGRASDGRHYPHGRVMKVVLEKTDA